MSVSAVYQINPGIQNGGATATKWCAAGSAYASDSELRLTLDLVTLNNQSSARGANRPSLRALRAGRGRWEHRLIASAVIDVEASWLLPI